MSQQEKFFESLNKCLVYLSLFMVLRTLYVLPEFIRSEWRDWHAGKELKKMKIEFCAANPTMPTGSLYAMFTCESWYKK